MTARQAAGKAAGSSRFAAARAAALIQPAAVSEADGRSELPAQTRPRRSTLPASWEARV